MAETKEKKLRTAPPELRRKQIIDATITCISQRGISGTTMVAVTKLAGLSVGLANFHFKSKDALLEETLRSLAMEHREHWMKSLRNTDLSASEKVVAIVNAQFHPSICSKKKLAVWFAFFGETSYRKAYRAIATSIDSERIDVLIELLSEIANEEGSGLAPEGVALSLESLFDGLWLNMLMYPDRFSRELAYNQVFNYLNSCFPEQIAARP